MNWPLLISFAWHIGTNFAILGLIVAGAVISERLSGRWVTVVRACVAFLAFFVVLEWAAAQALSGSL